MIDPENISPEQLAHDQGVYAAYSTIRAMLEIPAMTKADMIDVLNDVMRVVAAVHPASMTPFDPSAALERQEYIDSLHKEFGREET